MVLAPDNTVGMANAAAGRWLDELATGREPGARLPAALRAVASWARALADGGGNGTDAARARVRTPARHWMVVHGSAFGDRDRDGDGDGSRVAVWLEAAQPPELAALTWPVGCQKSAWHVSCSDVPGCR